MRYHSEHFLIVFVYERLYNLLASKIRPQTGAGEKEEYFASQHGGQVTTLRTTGLFALSVWRYYCLGGSSVTILEVKLHETLV